MNTPDGRFQVTESVPDFLRDIRRSQVLDDVRCDELEARVAAGGLPDDARVVAGQLVRDGVLSEYQARRILVGRVHGLVVGRYTILDRLGSGGMGQVYKAKHAMMGRVVALKFLANRHATDKGRIARFRREMQLVGLLDHPNIVRAFDADQYGDVPYIVMEYVPGQTLDALLRARGRLSVPEVLWFGSQVARGLEHAHKQGVLHRDIKPSNILFSRDRQVKLLDLGLGTFLERDPSDDCKTEAGATVGTMDYLSPEQACMKPLDGRSDIYSLGCTLYHLMAGRLPFEGDSSMERMAVRIIGRSVPIIQVMPELPEPVSAVMDRMLAREPAERFQTAAELATTLTALVRPRSGETPSYSASGGNGSTAPATLAPPTPTPASAVPPSEAALAPPLVPAPSQRATPAAPARPAGAPTDGRVTPATAPAAASIVHSSVSPSQPAQASTAAPVETKPTPGTLATDSPEVWSLLKSARISSRRALVGWAAGLLALVGGLGYLVPRLTSPSMSPTSGFPVTTNPVGAVRTPAPANPLSGSTPPVAPATSPPSPAAVEQLAQAGQWAAAAAALEIETTTDPKNLALVHRAAVALMMAGNPDGCRRLGAEKFAAVANQDNPGAVDVIRACCLIGGNLPESKWPVELARKTALSDPKAAWRFYILGLVHFRAGQDEEAIRRLTESIRLDAYWAGSPLNWPILSLAHRRLGHAAEAQTWLTKARDRRSLVPPETPTNVDPPWYDRAEFDILLREAEVAATPH